MVPASAGKKVCFSLSFPPRHLAITTARTKLDADIQVEAWEKRLGLLSETLDEWVAVQRNWMYLETIFCAEDIQKQLPDEAAKFQASLAHVGPLRLKVGTLTICTDRQLTPWRTCAAFG